MPRLALQITLTSFADRHQPGFLNATFSDALGHVHTLMDKVPVLSLEDLDENSEYPRLGGILCRIIDAHADFHNPDIVKIEIEEPRRISTPGESTIFFVRKDQLIELH